MEDMDKLCECGCGKLTNVATRTNPKYGHVKGKPMRFIIGHGRWANSLEKRLWSRIDKRGPDDCWDWTGAHTPAGYGVISRNGSATTATRVVYELTYGPIPNGLIVCHTCDNPACCNPTHLWIGTNADNSDDKVSKGREGHPDNRGEHNPRASLSNNDVIAIREANRNGENLASIAARYNLQKPAIWKIVHRLTWNHIQ